jgi:FixJ family two-component response regulator
MTTIAIIDDDLGLRKALGRLLSIYGYRSETFGSAEEFLLAAPTSKVTCILVDINLGDTSGLELVRQLSVSGLKFPVIFISGVDDETTKSRAMELGCIALLRKPILAHLLLEAIKKATGSTIKSDAATHQLGHR